MAKVKFIQSLGNIEELDVSISGLSTGGQMTLIGIDDTGWTKMEQSGSTEPTGSGPLTNRNAISIQNQSTSTNIMYSYQNSAAVEYGKVILLNFGVQNLDITDGIDVYCRAVSGSANVMLEEIA